MDAVGGRRALVIAHRGASADAPANTLEAFAKAIDAGADMIEFDVRRTADDQLVVFHDPRVGAMPVRRLTREELSSRSRRATPTLQELLELTAGRIALDVELKEDGYVARVVEAVRRRLEREQVVFTSFHDRVVAEVKLLYPGARTGLLLGHQRVRSSFGIRRARHVGADYIAPHYKLADRGLLESADAAGLPALVWTVNDPVLLASLLGDERVAGVITDTPGRALELRAA